MKNINKTGYLEGGPTEDNDYNIIPSNKITMKGVNKNLVAIKLDKKGKPIGMEFMKPGKDYEFDDTYSVLEVPQYQIGGQNLNINYDLGDTSRVGNPYMQSTFAPSNPNDPSNIINLTPEQLNNNDPLINQPFPQLNAFKGIPTEDEIEMSELEASTQELNDFTKTLPENNNGQIDPNFIGQEVNKDLGMSSNDELKELVPFEQSEFDRIQFFNPYGGVDIPTAATTLGQSISNKDTLGTVASSVKLAAGLGRNFLGGLGAQKRTNQTMKDYYEGIREEGNIISLQKGGMKKEELLTGEYITGVDEDSKYKQSTNAEIEKGEYYATNEGDIAEVVGKTHKQGGEKVIMEGGDRVLTDHTKLGASNAKMIRNKFDIEVKAKNTYSDVLDKYRVKSGMSKLIKEEEGLLKELEKQNELEDSETKSLNNKFLQDKLNEITFKKSPLEEGRKFLYDELYTLQEKDKPKSEQAFYQQGGQLPEYLGRDHLTGEGIALDSIPEGQSLTEQGFFGGIDDTSFAKTKAINPWFDWTNFNPANPEDVKRFQAEYNKLSDKGSQVTIDGKFGQQTQSIHIPWLVPQEPVIEPLPAPEPVPEEKRDLNALLLPDQYPMVPEGTQPALKNLRRYDRVEAAQIDPTKYLQEIGDQRIAANRQTEGLSPNVRAAALANVDANTQKSISDAMLRIDTANIQSKNQAEVTNARIQGREEDARVLDNLSFEKRQLTADAKTDLDFQNYFDKVREVNLGNFRQVNAINNANARHDNIQFDGNGYVVRDAPDFSNTLNATQLAQMNTMLEEYEKSKK